MSRKTSHKQSVSQSKSARRPEVPPQAAKEEPVQAAKQPHFPWLGEAAPRDVRRTFADKFLAMHRRELSERASLLRRLGYGRDEVRQRLEQYESWEYEPFHRSQLEREVAEIVAEVFATATPRTTTLSPGR